MIMNGKVSDMWVGHIDASIANLVTDIPDLITRFPFVLITCIDSSRELRKLKTTKKIVEKYPGCQFVNNNLLMSGTLFTEISHSQHLLNGFDEIWLSFVLPVEAVPGEFWMVSPRNIVNDIPPGLAEWMKRTGCIIGMGDGTGLNYVTEEVAISELLEGMYGE